MRLVCPNCGAQYEVPDEVIPQSGRDVQCSNCGDTWFQTHPDAKTDLTTDFDETASEVPQVEDATDQPQEPADPPEGAPWPQDPEAPHEDAVEQRDMPPVQPPRQRELDPSVADVLREEAARESEARKSEAGVLEEQPDLGLAAPDDEATRRQREAESRMARLRGEPEPAAGSAAVAAATGSRRDVLPDIDEINSTLRKDTERRKTATEAAASREAEPKSGGFRKGFFAVLLLALILILVYVFAAQISEAVPALAPYLESYVLTVNDARIWLDTQLRGLLGSLDGMASEGSESAAPSE